MSSVVDRLGETGKTYSTWGGLSCSPERYFEPETYDDVKQIVQAAGANGKSVRVIGNGYSLNPQALTSDYLISLNKFNKISKVDKETCQITIGAGAILKYLDEKILPEQGFGISVHPGVKSIAIGGLCTTGIFGTGKRYRGVSNYIVAMEMMLASGEIIEISETKNVDLLPAARLSLGVLGIILNVTLQCEPGFRLHQRDYRTRTSYMLDNIEAMVGYTDHFMFLIPSENNFECAIGKHVSRNEEDLKALPFEDGDLLHTQSDRSDNIFMPPRDPSWSNILYIMEWAVARDKTKDITVEFIKCLKELNIGSSMIGCKFVREDDLYLSQAYDKDICYVELFIFNSANSTVDKEALKPKMYATLNPIAAAYGGIPHWTQYYDLPSVDYSKLYPKWQTFLDIRHRLDPAGTFLNTELKAVFLP